MASNIKNVSYIKKILGFSLIELMIVIALISLLTAMAVSIYSGYDCKTKQTEAKKNLVMIYNGQTAYYTEHMHYAAELADLGFSLKTTGKKHITGWYLYDPGGKDQSFIAKAYDGPNGDAWSINELKNLGVMTNGCGK